MHALFYFVSHCNLHCHLACTDSCELGTRSQGGRSVSPGDWWHECPALRCALPKPHMRQHRCVPVAEYECYCCGAALSTLPALAVAGLGLSQLQHAC